LVCELLSLLVVLRKISNLERNKLRSIVNNAQWRKVNAQS
jgi:hypothetical protein